ncbi:putative protein isoform X1 [Capsicum galapagoense]
MEYYPKSHLGYLYYQYSEVAAVKWRYPLVDKVIDLSKNHPGIMTLKSIDLAPASWMAVAWRPIYYTPMKEIKKNVSTHFLTYHTISSIYQENLNNEAGEDMPRKDDRISLLPFGLASYKMQSDIWINKAEAHRKFDNLQGAVDSWLKQLNFNHYDFNIFSSKFNMDHIYLF